MRIAGLAALAALFAVSVSGAADAPAPTGLDALAARLPGTWKTAGQTFDTSVTKAGPQNYTTVHDCWREGDAYKCVFVVNGTLQLYDIYAWNAGDSMYGMTQITPQGRQPEFRLTIKGDNWTYDQDINTAQGQVIHYRIVRSYTSATTADYTYEFSSDGKAWTEIAKGTDTRLDAGK